MAPQDLGHVFKLAHLSTYVKALMFTQGTGENGLAVVVDCQSKFDYETESVLRDWPAGRQALGRAEWAKTLRIALREYGSNPWTAKQLAEKKDAILSYCERAGIRCVVPVQSANVPNTRTVHTSWNLFGHSGNPYKWAGTVEKQSVCFVAPILNPANFEYVYGWLIRRWIRQAHAVAQGVLAPLPWLSPLIKPDAEMLAALTEYRFSKSPIAVDIETNMAGTVITAIGVSDGETTIACPWDEYNIAGTNGEKEPALTSYPLGDKIRATMIQVLQDASVKKILHNGAFDVVQLGKRGITLRGFEHDTLLMHRVVYSQYRHGLQQACATEFCVSPWKSLFKPPRQSKGEDVWLGCPVELRLYNTRDSYATWQLYQHLKEKLG